MDGGGEKQDETQIYDYLEEFCYLIYIEHRPVDRIGVVIASFPDTKQFVIFFCRGTCVTYPSNTKGGQVFIPNYNGLRLNDCCFGGVNMLLFRDSGLILLCTACSNFTPQFGVSSVEGAVVCCYCDICGSRHIRMECLHIYIFSNTNKNNRVSRKTFIILPTYYNSKQKNITIIGVKWQVLKKVVSLVRTL